MILIICYGTWHNDLIHCWAFHLDELEYDDSGNDLHAIPEAPPTRASNPILDVPILSIDEEDSKIMALVNTPALDWQR